MKLIVYIAFFLLVSCGSSVIEVTYIEIDKQTLDSICNSGDCDGYAEWNLNKGICTIWTMPRQDHSSDQRYHEVLGHEMRHCIEGVWHE